MDDPQARVRAVLEVDATASELAALLEEVRSRGLGVNAVPAGSAGSGGVRAIRMDAAARTTQALGHEVANYLGTIRTMAYLLAEEVPAGSDARGDVDTVTDTVDAGIRFLETIRGFVHPELLGDGVTDLNAVVREAEPTLRDAMAPRASVAPRLAERPLWVRGDAGPLGRVVGDLVRAAASCAARGEVVAIETGGPGAESRAELLVRVRGRELQPDVLARIFEPFVADRGYEGGLRLPTVYAVVTQSGGAVAVEAEPGAVVTFRVGLPSAEAPAAVGRPGGRVL